MTVTADKKQELRDRVREAIARDREHIVEVAETIRQNPEFQFEEHMASNLLADHLREVGFEVEKPHAGMETAFLAKLDSGKPGPKVAVLAEYDALRGIGHGCGHNLIAGSGLATAIGIKDVIEELGGAFMVIGTPAEEGGGGKLYELEHGTFEGVDACLMIHHGGNKSGAPAQWPDGTCLAVTGFDFEFYGSPAHSAMDPENGVNALNAVIKVFTGVDALRQHTRMDARIHGIITEGGQAANVVPKYAACRMMVRAASRSYMRELADKVEKIAEGAALMTGCELKTTPSLEMYDMRPSYVIGRLYQQNADEVGLEGSGGREGRGMHSTDFGNVSYQVPSVTLSFAISHEPIPGHSQEVVDASGSEYGYEQFMKSSTAMALTAFDLMTNPEITEQAWEEHRNWSERYEG